MKKYTTAVTTAIDINEQNSHSDALLLAALIVIVLVVLGAWACSVLFGQAKRKIRK